MKSEPLPAGMNLPTCSTHQQAAKVPNPGGPSEIIIIQEKSMGRKGNSVKKPKSSSLPGNKTNKNPSVTELVKDKGAPLTRVSANPGTDSNKKTKK